ncbi:hypothetical protein L6452_40603 [Arctium lappa]|uniref:Uncharacterized protein n=1 Tax=Arctium lappa TaxID=4217 RepID=A0ACB8XNK1_ARCLA|nr:hypothetical protein L6452_40603 [Arctium lappa]
MDVKSAFLNGQIQDEVYVQQPPGFENSKYPNHVYFLDKALYGLKQAPRAWYDRLSNFLLANSFEKGTTDTTLFFKKRKGEILLVQIYVDDIIFRSTNDLYCKKFESLMKSEFEMSMMGELTFFLGLQVKQTTKGIFINQSKYVSDILEKYKLSDSSPMKTPMSTGSKLHADPEGKPVECKLYRGMIGSLLYLTASRPDIMFATCLCARFQANPKESHLYAVKRIFRYLKGTKNLGLWYPENSGFDLMAYTDSDYGGCKLDRKSTYGSCQFLGGKLVSWTSKKQNCVSTSTAEAEYVAAASCCSQVLWMRTQLRDYGFDIEKIPILCDSKSAIAISANPVQHSKTKHIDIGYHFLKHHVEQGTIEMYFVPTDYQLTDLFTKALDEKRFTFLVGKIGTRSFHRTFLHLKLAYDLRSLLFTELLSFSSLEKLRTSSKKPFLFSSVLSMASPSSSSKNSNGSKKSNNSHHSMVQKADSDSVDQEHVLTSRMLSFTRHDYHLTQLNNKPNNHFVTLNPSGFPTKAAPLIQLLKIHFLVRALTMKRFDIPESYIQQFWLSARHVKMDKYGHCIIGYATHPSTEKILDLGINRRKLSDVFGLPTKTDLNLRKFSEEPTEEEILEFLRFIGYAVPITKRTNFRRQNLPPLWNVLFSILNRCLTSKVGSPDQSSHTILAIMYGIYYDLPLDYARLIFREIQNAVITKQQDQDRGTEPKNIVFGRFLGLLLGDDLIGEGKLPTEDKTIKLYDMKSHKPTTIKTGYPEARPLSTKMLTYLGSEEEAREYIRGNMTPEPQVQATEAKKSEKENPLVRGEGSERKKKKKNKKTRVAVAEGQTKPLQKARKALVLPVSLEDGPQSPTQIASAIAREVSLQYSGGLGETVAMELDDVTGWLQSDNDEVEPSKTSLEERDIKDAFGTPPKPTPSATHTSTPAVLVQRGIEIGPHSPNPA